MTLSISPTFYHNHRIEQFQKSKRGSFKNYSRTHNPNYNKMKSRKLKNPFYFSIQLCIQLCIVVYIFYSSLSFPTMQMPTSNIDNIQNNKYDFHKYMYNNLKYYVYDCFFLARKSKSTNTGFSHDISSHNNKDNVKMKIPFFVEAAVVSPTDYSALSTTSVLGKLTLPISSSSSGNSQNQNEIITIAPEPTKLVLRGKLEDDTSKGVEYFAYSKIDGSFEFKDIPKGVYLLDILCPRFYYSQFKVMVLDDNDDETKRNLKVSVLEFYFNGSQKIRSNYPINVMAHSQINYFEYMDPYASLRNAMFNPMLWMMLFGLAMSYYMPKMMENMDEDTRKQFEQQQASMANPESMLSSLLGGAPPPTASSSSSSSSTSSNANQGSSTTSSFNSNKSQNKQGGKRVAAHRRK